MWKENKRPLTGGYGTLALAFFDVDGDVVPDVEIMALTASPLFGTVLNR